MRLSVAASSDPSKGEWGGYCWEVAPVDGTLLKKVSLEFADVTTEAEVELKLEMINNTVQEASMQFLKQGTLDVDLSIFPKVRPEIGRVCIMLLGRSTDKGVKQAEFTLSKVTLS